MTGTKLVTRARDHLGAIKSRSIACQIRACKAIDHCKAGFLLKGRRWHRVSCPACAMPLRCMHVLMNAKDNRFTCPIIYTALCTPCPPTLG